MDWESGLIILSSINVSIILTIIIIKTIYTPSSTLSRRHLLFSLTRLLGMLTGSLLGFVLSAEESMATCLVIRAGVGTSYVLIYASIMVKQVFIISLNIGIYLTLFYQILLFFFSVLVQVILSIQWLILVPPCHYTSQDHILTLFYNFLLVFFITIISVRSLGLKHRSEESSSICLVMIVNLSTWIIWMMAACLLPTVYHPAAFGRKIFTMINLILH